MLHKTYTEAEVKQFYEDLESIKVRKPIATLARLSGLSTGNVSEYLSKKKIASDKLINTFYEHFGSSIKSLSKKNAEEMPDNMAEAWKAIHELIAVNNKHADHLGRLVDKISSIGTGVASLPSESKEEDEQIVLKKIPLDKPRKRLSLKSAKKTGNAN